MFSWQFSVWFQVSHWLFRGEREEEVRSTSRREIPGSGDTGNLQDGHCKKLCIERQVGEIYSWAGLSVTSNKGYCKKFKLPSSSPLLIIGMRNSFFSFPNCFTMARVITPLKTWTNGYNIEPPEPLRICLWWTNPCTDRKENYRNRWLRQFLSPPVQRTVTCGINWIHLRSNVSVIKQICGSFDSICHTYVGVAIILLDLYSIGKI